MHLIELIKRACDPLTEASSLENYQSERNMKWLLPYSLTPYYPFHCREVAFVRAPEIWAFYGAFYGAPNLTLNTKKRVKYCRDSFLSPLLETLYKRECFYIELTVIYFSSFHLSCDIKSHVIADSQ